MFGLIVFADGSMEEKNHAAFLVFDTDNNLTMDKEEMRKYFRFVLES